MINQQANQLLQQTEAAIRAKVKPEQRQNVEKVVTAGLKVLDSEQSHQMVVSQLKMKTDPVNIAGVGTAKLMALLMNQSKGVMPMAAAMPAAVILLCEALDRLEALGMVKVTGKTIAAATMSMQSALMQALGITPRKLDAVMKGQGQQPPQPAQPPQAAQQPAPPAQPAGPQPLIGAPA